jgi:hypothetical protein
MLACGMRHQTVHITAASLDSFGQPTVRVTPVAGTRLLPGHAVLVGLPGEPLLRQVFPSAIGSDDLDLLLDPGPGAFPGEAIDLFTLSGRGFNPPDRARRWLLFSLRPTPSRLMPLVQAGIAIGAELALASRNPPDGLPPSVEVVPALEAAFDWAEYIAGDADMADLAPGSAEVALPDVPAEVLVGSPMPCGTGACGACALPGARLPRLLCREGPVVDLRRYPVQRV